MSLLSIGIAAVERGFVPDWFARRSIRRLCQQRLIDCAEAARAQTAERGDFERSLHDGPIAPLPEKANEQHYELPAAFFAAMLGPRLKYSCCFFPEADCSLAEAEETALTLTCQHAELQDGHEILELGCGWGSLSLWMAEKYPASRITAVSNSLRQREFIEAAAAERGLANLRVITADMNHFAPPQGAGVGPFDRVVSVEMFEHMRNYKLLLARIATWLKTDGRLFVHHFCHREWAYPFETESSADWMGRYFFTGGMMPSATLLRQFDSDLTLIQQCRWDGTHYQRTALAWLENLDAHHGEVLDILKTTFGQKEAARWLQRWRLFLLAVSELFGYQSGQEWFVAHCLLQPALLRTNKVESCPSC